MTSPSIEVDLDMEPFERHLSQLCVFTFDGVDLQVACRHCRSSENKKTTNSTQKQTKNRNAAIADGDGSVFDTHHGGDDDDYYDDRLSFCH